MPDLVITGEGSLDRQTISGKIPIGVARVAKRHNKPVISIAGSLTDGSCVVHEHGYAVVSVLSRACSLTEALADGAKNVRQTARNVAAILKMAKILIKNRLCI